MFITLSNHDTSKKVDLAYGIDNCDGNKEVSIHEVSYTIKWVNVTGGDYYIVVEKKRGAYRGDYFGGWLLQFLYSKRNTV